MYLLDTNVVFELRRPRPHGAVVAWIDGIHEADVHVSAVSIGEIQSGIELTRERDPEKAADLERWLERIVGTGNILPMDARAFRVWARLMHHRSDDSIEDAMIAATAIVENLIVVTRNVRDFAPFGVRTIDPFDAR